MYDGNVEVTLGCLKKKKRERERGGGWKEECKRDAKPGM